MMLRDNYERFPLSFSLSRKLNYENKILFCRFMIKEFLVDMTERMKKKKRIEIMMNRIQTKIVLFFIYLLCRL